MATNVSAAFPELVLPPDATITVELDDPAAIVTKLNVFGFTPAREPDDVPEKFGPLFTYGAAQQLVFAVTSWPDVGVAAVVALPGILAAVLGYLNRREMRTPSGDSLGKVAERTEHLAAANVALSTQTVKILNGGSDEEQVDNAA